MTVLRPLLLLLALLASGDRLMAMPEPSPPTQNLAHGMATLTPPLESSSGSPLSLLPATQGEGHWPRYARVMLLAQAPPSSPTPVPAPAPTPQGEGDGGGPFRPSEDVPADAEVDFPGDI